MDAQELPCHLEVRDCCEPLQSCKPNRRPTCARKGASTITSRESGPNVFRPSFLLSIDMRPARPDSHQLDTSVLVGGPDGRRSCHCESFPTAVSALPRGWAWYNWCVRPPAELTMTPRLRWCLDQ
jgi:hypothetical protein